MHIGHVALQVTDLGRSVAHARETLGLELTAAGDAHALLTANAKHHELQLLGSPRAGLDHIGLELESVSELDALRDRLIGAGATILTETSAEPGLEHAIRAQGPAGVVFELYVGMRRAPLSLENVLRPVATKLGHVTLFSDQKDELERFILEVLGFRVSDRVADDVTWMRCDPDHHGLAVGRLPAGSGTRLHHYAFDLGGWSALGAYADRVARSGQRFVWGPGRHGPGFNQFTYLLDPDGVVVEAYADLLRIEDEAAYVPIDWSGEPRSMNLWGTLAPEGWDDLGVPVLEPSPATAQPA